jgi:UDP-N-acetyl-D-glucosamine dehydrogenase
MELLMKRGIDLSYSDPYVPRYRVGPDVFCRTERWLQSVDLTDETLGVADCVVIISDHQSINYAQVVRAAKVVVDTRNATRGLAGAARVVRVGAPLYDAPRG